MTAPSATRFRPNLFLSPFTQGHQRITLAAVPLPRLPTDGGLQNKEQTKVKARDNHKR